MNVKVFSPELLGDLVAQAQLSPRARQHLNIHQSFEDPCQRFLNAVGADSYIRPHRHSLDPKDECLIAIQGKFALIAFGEDGKIERVIRFGTEKYAECSAGVELPAGLWHTVVALVPGAVLLELKAGPFRSDAAKEPAPWSPAEGSAESGAYLAHLRQVIDGWQS